MAEIGSYILAGSQGLASGLDKLGARWQDMQEREQAQQLLSKLGVFGPQNPIPNAQPAQPQTLASLTQPVQQPIAPQNPGSATTSQLPQISPANRPVAQGFANEMGQKWAQQPGQIGGQVPALAGMSAPSSAYQPQSTMQARGPDGGSSPQRQAMSFAGNGGGTAQAFLGTLQASGLTNPNALAAVGATGYHESRWSPDKIAGSWSDPSQSGQPGIAGGALSWRADRLERLRSFAASRGERGNGSLETQAQFFMQEDPQLVARLNEARSPQEAMSLMNNAWRYAGYNKPDGETAARMQSAQAWAGGGAGQGQTNPLANVAPMSGGAQPQAMPQTLAQLSAPQQQQLDMQTLGALLGNRITAPIAQSILARQLSRDPVQMQMQLIELQKAQMGLQNAPLQQQMVAEQLRAAQLGNQRTAAEISGDSVATTPDMKEFALAKRQGFQGTFLDYQQAKSAAKQKPGLSASDQKVIFAEEDQLPAIDNTIETLRRAKELNTKTYTGFTAGARGSVMSGLGIGGEDAKATREFGQIMSMEAIKSMSSLLKGATTDKEMMEFQRLLSDPTTPPDIRQRTINRMLTLAERQKQIATGRINELRAKGGQPPIGAQRQQGSMSDPLGIR